MIKLKMKANEAYYPRVDMICPMCGETITYWNISPYACVKCKGVLPNIDTIIKVLKDRVTYYKTIKEHW